MQEKENRTQPNPRGVKFGPGPTALVMKLPFCVDKGTEEAVSRSWTSSIFDPAAVRSQANCHTAPPPPSPCHPAVSKRQTGKQLHSHLHRQRRVTLQHSTPLHKCNYTNQLMTRRRVVIWQADSDSVDQNVHRLLLDLKVHYPVHMSPRDLILSQFNPSHNPKPYFFKTDYITYSHVCLGNPSIST
jgi:hypothetical protein